MKFFFKADVGRQKAEFTVQAMSDALNLWKTIQNIKQAKCCQVTNGLTVKKKVYNMSAKFKVVLTFIKSKKVYSSITVKLLLSDHPRERAN